MGRKDYVAIAEVLNGIIQQTDNYLEIETVRWVADDLAVLFAEGNPRFDRERFLTACGVK